jgi:hypothetical protein
VLGYYDPKEKEMVVRQTGERIGPHEEVTFVHEFTHALQDQYFDLHGTREQLRELDNSDRHAAYLALVEGDAILTESIYIFEHMTEDEQILMFLGGGGMGPDLDEIPEYLIRTLLFPYIKGADFVLYLYRQGGWDAVNRAYEEPPLSSSHILHPQKYLEGEQPVDVDLGAIEDALHESWEVRQTDVMGEFVLYLHLELFLEEAIARQAARGWRGDRYVYLVDDADEELFVMRTHWDDATEAHRFFDAYNAFIDAQSGGAWSMSQANAGERRWQTGAGREVLLRHEGETVLLVLSPHGDATRDVMDALAE